MFNSFFSSVMRYLNGNDSAEAANIDPPIFKNQNTTFKEILNFQVTHRNTLTTNRHHQKHTLLDTANFETHHSTVVASSIEQRRIK